MRNLHSPLRIILIAYALLGVLYSVATPIFEASDEVWHYAVVRHIALTGELPVQQAGVKTAWEQEGSQPPLYYWLMSPLVAWFDQTDDRPRPIFNPHAQPGNSSLEANRNLTIHSPAENFPWQGVALAVQLIRLISIGLGAITIGCGYALARRLFPDRSSIPIGTAALIAFNPMFIFISVSVNNDNLVIALSSLALYLTVVIYQEDQLDRAAWLRRVALGVVLGAAALTKISGLTLLPIVGAMLTVRHLDLGGFRERTNRADSQTKTSEVLAGREWGAWLITGILLIAIVVIAAGWWYLRNVQLYGDPFGLDMMAAIAGPRITPQTIGQLIAEFDGFRYSYWALFGAVNILTISIAYTIFDAFTALALVGLMMWLAVNRRREPALSLLVLLSYALLVFVGVIRWTLMTPASQGRLMFTGIAVISLGLWLGWDTVFNFQFLMRNDQLVPGQWRKLRWVIPAFMLLVAAISPIAYIAPVYAGPIMLAPDQVPATLTPLEVDFGANMRLLGYVAPARATSDGTAEFTLYWQCLRQPGADLSVFVIVYGRGLSEIGKRDAYPYRGLFGTRQCAAGQVFADPYHVRLQADAVRPTVLRVQIGLKDRARDVELTPTINGLAVSSVIFTAGSLPPDRTVAAPSIEARYRLGDVIELLGYEVDPQANEVRYRLYWRVLKDGAEDFTIFAHLLTADGVQIGQGDSQPFDGDYPTSVWRAGETFVEERSIPVTAPAGAKLALGLYRLADGTRLPVVDSAGAQVQDNQVIISVQP